MFYIIRQNVINYVSNRIPFWISSIDVFFDIEILPSFVNPEVHTSAIRKRLNECEVCVLPVFH